MQQPELKCCDVIIIGSGVIGASIAYHLTLNGIKNITVLDSGSYPGSGSTGKATGGFRSQFGSEINIKLSLLSQKKLLSFNDEHGIDPGYLPAGYLFLAQSQDELNNLKLANSLQQSSGLNEAKLVTTGEISEINPHINLKNIIGGSFCGSDGFIDPLKILKGYIESSKKAGVKFRYNSSVTGIELSGGKINNIETSNGKFSADIIINAAGAWAGNIAAMSGETLPVTRLKRQVGRITEKNTLPNNTPMTIWIGNSFHFRMRDEHLILLMPCEPENNNNIEIETAWLEKVFNIAKDKIPVLSNCGIEYSASWAGLYEMSPDEHVILGRSENITNFYYANGSSGHGVMHSPAIGELLANIICNMPNDIDTGILSSSRFTQNKFIEQIHFF